MKPGGGKGKGASYERWVAKQLSLWVSRKQRTDIFWRTAMSGGRATVAHKRGGDVRQCGDICAVSHEGHPFCGLWFPECKHVRDLSIQSFILRNQGPLAKFWEKACKQAQHHHLLPMIICRQNGTRDLIVVPSNTLRRTPVLVTVKNKMLLDACDIAYLDHMFRYEPRP